jgi:hypothetical protein
MRGGRKRCLCKMVTYIGGIIFVGGDLQRLDDYDGFGVVILWCATRDRRCSI